VYNYAVFARIFCKYIMYSTCIVVPCQVSKDVHFDWHSSFTLDSEQKIYTGLTECCFHLNKQTEDAIDHLFPDAISLL
jgi:hypothetical protein